MSAPPSDIRPGFWQNIALDDLTPAEWEALCDGCGKCCLNKIEYEDTGEVEYTRIACRLLDGASCRCKHYQTRHQFVPDCVRLSPQTLPKIAYWLPRSCAYRLLYEGTPLPDWHPLNTQDPDSTHKAGASVQGWTIPETEVNEDDWDDYILIDTP